MDEAEGDGFGRRGGGAGENVYMRVVEALREEEGLDLSDDAIRGRLLELAFLLAEQEAGRAQ